jgi:hypothetical protein
MVESSKMFADLMSRCTIGGTAWSKKQQLLHKSSQTMLAHVHKVIIDSGWDNG